MTTKLFTVDARCSSCFRKGDCPTRVEAITTLNALASKLSTDPVFSDSPGEGILILSCADHAVAPA